MFDYEFNTFFFDDSTEFIFKIVTFYHVLWMDIGTGTLSLIFLKIFDI